MSNEERQDVCVKVIDILYTFGTQEALCILGRLTNGLLHTIKDVETRNEIMVQWIEKLMMCERDMRQGDDNKRLN